MAVNIHITIIELNALHTKRQSLFQELDAVIHLLMEAKHWGLRKSRNATSLRSEERFSRNAETDLVCRLLLEKKKILYSVTLSNTYSRSHMCWFWELNLSTQ